MTLVELLVVLTMIGLLLLATLPSMSAWMRNTQIRTAMESLLNGLSRARNEAVKRNTPVRFSLVTASSGNPGKLDNTCALSNTSAPATSASWVVSLQNPASACAAAPDDTTAPMILEKWASGESGSTITVAVRQANTDGSCGSADLDWPSVAFDGFGRINRFYNHSNSSSSAPPSASLCLVINNSAGSGNRTLNINIGLGGSLRACDPAVTSATDPRKC